jgi:hypothetical protein
LNTVVSGSAGKRRRNDDNRNARNCKRSAVMRVCTAGEGSGSDLGAGGSGNEAGGGEMEYDGRVVGIGVSAGKEGDMGRSGQYFALMIPPLIGSHVLGLSRWVCICPRASGLRFRPAALRCEEAKLGQTRRALCRCYRRAGGQSPPACRRVPARTAHRQHGVAPGPSRCALASWRASVQPPERRSAPPCWRSKDQARLFW